MQSKGWQLNDDGYWSKDGKAMRLVIDIFPIFNDITPILVAQLQKAGFDTDFRMTSDAYTRMSQGRARAFMNGHGGSVRDPYFTLRLYHSRFVQSTDRAFLAMGKRGLRRNRRPYGLRSAGRSRIDRALSTSDGDLAC
jgi:hypothetical protein